MSKAFETDCQANGKNDDAKNSLEKKNPGKFYLFNFSGSKPNHLIKRKELKKELIIIVQL